MPGVAGGVVAVQPPAAAQVDDAGALDGAGCARPGSAPARRTGRPARRRRPAGRWPSAGTGRPGAGRRARAPRPRRPGNICAMSPVPPAWSRWMWVTTTVARSRGPTPSAARASRTSGADGAVPGLDQARPVAADQVARGDPVVPGHPGVDLEHLVAQVGDHVARVRHDGMISGPVPAGAGSGSFRLSRLLRLEGGVRPQAQSFASNRLASPPVQLSANVRITIPDRGLGPNEVDLRGTIRSWAATAYTSAADIGEASTAVRPGASSAARSGAGRVVLHADRGLVVADLPHAVHQQVLEHRAGQVPPRLGGLGRPWPRPAGPGRGR